MFTNEPFRTYFQWLHGYNGFAMFLANKMNAIVLQGSNIVG